MLTFFYFITVVDVLKGGRSSANANIYALNFFRSRKQNSAKHIMQGLCKFFEQIQ